MHSRIFNKHSTPEFIANEIDSYLISLMMEQDISSVSYAIIDNNETSSANTLSINKDIQVSNESLFQACSLSKCLTAYAVLLLASQKKFDLDKPINSQLVAWQIPSENKGDVVKARHCLSMTSGLVYGHPSQLVTAYTPEKQIPSLDEILNGKAPALNLPVTVHTKPGDNYYYSGAGYMVLQKLIEEKSGQSFAEFMLNNILLPMGMSNSNFECPISEKKINNVVPGINKEKPIHENGWDNIPTAASGGLWSTAKDLALFTINLSQSYLGCNDFIPTNLAIDMLTPQKNSDFGLGVVVDGEGQTLNFRKNGNNAYYHCELIMFPNTGKGLVVMTNTGRGISLIEKFIEYIANKNHWPSYSDIFTELHRKPSYKK